MRFLVCCTSITASLRCFECCSTGTFWYWKSITISAFRFFKSQVQFAQGRSTHRYNFQLQKRFYPSPIKHAYTPASLELFILPLTDLFIIHILQHQLQRSTKIFVFNHWSHNPLCEHCIWTLVSVPKRTLKFRAELHRTKAVHMTDFIKGLKIAFRMDLITKGLISLDKCSLKHPGIWFRHSKTKIYKAI